MDSYVGVDVHKLTYYAAVLSSDGRKVEFSCPADPAGFIRKLKDMRINILGLAYESGPTGYELAWQCQDAGLPVMVAAASKIPRPISARCPARLQVLPQVMSKCSPRKALAGAGCWINFGNG